MDWLIGFIVPYMFTNSGLQAIQCHHILSSSLLHTHRGSQAALRLSCQQIYHSLTVTSPHTWSPLSTTFSINFNCHFYKINTVQFLISPHVCIPNFETSLSTDILEPMEIIIWNFSWRVFTGFLPSDGCSRVMCTYVVGMSLPTFPSNGYK